MRLDFWLYPHETCPKCGGKIKMSYVEDNPKKSTEAFLNYACEKCGPVLVKVYDLNSPVKSK
jgi:hypothetical protein